MRRARFLLLPRLATAALAEGHPAGLQQASTTTMTTIIASSSSSSLQPQHRRHPFSSRPPHSKWRMLQEQGHDVNPCNSKLHPAYVSGEIEVDGAKRELAVQEAYTPDSQCFGCGPAAPDGLGLRSFRDAGGLLARSTIDHKYQAFPGIVNGGIVSALFDCHGNWTAAVALMDRSCLPRPPLTLTAELLVNFREPTPPGVPLIVRSTVARVRESASAGSGKASVQVDLTLHALSESGSGSGGAEGSSDSGISSSSGGGGGGKEKETLLATATGIFKKLGALRAL